MISIRKFWINFEFPLLYETKITAHSKKASAQLLRQNNKKIKIQINFIESS